MHLVVNVGDRVVLWCTGQDLSQLQGNVILTWEKSHKTIPADDPRLNTIANGTLELNDVQREDGGIYRCTVKAGEFQSINTTYLFVRDTYKHPNLTSNKMSPLQTQIEAMLSGNHSIDVTTVITQFVTLTRPGNEQRLNAKELSTSVNILELLVTYNSLQNNGAFTKPADRRNILVAGSNLLDEENTQTWLQIQRNHENVTDVLLETMDEFASQISSQLGSSINSTSFVLSSRNIGIRVDRVDTIQMLAVDFSQYGASVLFPGSVFANSPTNIVAVVAYNSLHNFFRLERKASDNEQEKRPETSRIISAKIIPRPTSPLRVPFKLVFDHNNKGGDLIGQCVFWEIGQSHRTWQTRGCMRVDHESNARSTTCECDHLTIFSVLLNNEPIDGGEQHQPYLGYISTTGCACSLLFLLLTFAVIVLYWKRVKSARTIILLNLCVAIAASCIFIILADHARRPKVLCTITATFLHYFLLSVFSWMLCHGVILYFLIIKVETRETLEPKMKWLYALGWGSPLSIVAVSLIVTGTEVNAANNCWLTTKHGVIYWAFAAPVATVITINSILLIFLLRQINRAAQFKASMSRARPCAKQVKAWLRRTAMLLPVLGVTWLFGFLTFISSTVVFHYLFTILNSLQGFFIFVTFCILDDAVKETLIGTLCKRNAVSSKEQSTLNSKNAVRSISVTRIQTVQNARTTAANQHGGTYNFSSDTEQSKVSGPKMQTWIVADIK
ncbi:adhesion G-protein coupled receptor D1-like [Pocillopora damicornis]|uniref:adhesion G-protein coupled receptor D1-like n=1 Tax=Pocillopora damicornis TaxID=46731 RepID=UPI000F54E302|nr:adhesion G-protein coupled receptor D1-like [Pocillopora damicornis]